MFAKIILFLLALSAIYADNQGEPKMLNPSRLLLAKIRGGDYAHAGDKEAVDQVIAQLLQIDPNAQVRPVLDVGCGMGGTAADFHRLGFQSVTGIDIDAPAVSYAKEKYPPVNFLVGDANNLSHFLERRFSLITFFNVLYSIENKAHLFQQLTAVAKPGAILVLFDYTATDKSFQLKDLAGKPMFPMRIDEVSSQLSPLGWQLIEKTDLTSQYIHWYRTLLPKIDEPTLKATFTHLLESLENNSLNASVIYYKLDLKLVCC